MTKRKKQKQGRWILVMLGWPVVAILLTGLVLAYQDKITLFIAERLP